MPANWCEPRPRVPVALRLAAISLVAMLLLVSCVSEAGTSEPGTATPETARPAAAPTQPPPTATPTAAASLPTAPTTPAPRAQEASNPAVQVYQRNAASVVNITSVAVVRTRQGASEQPLGTGSGFIFDQAGHIVTNDHVIEDADQLNVTFQGRATVPADLVGRDPDNDLAVIKVEPNGVDQDGRPIGDLLKPVQLGDSDRIVVGEDAIAIGSPLGLEQTVTSGIVSALRSPGEGIAAGQLDLLGGAVQTDAAINPGNSGGPLFNAAGEVIGVNSAILSQSGGNIGIGFAIPINVVKRVVPELIQTGCYHHPIVGISSLPLSLIGQSAKQQLGLPLNQKGLLVQESSAGAAQAGIRAGNRVVVLGGEQVRVGGDIIVAVDGRPVTGGGELRAYIENNKRPGNTVELTILRNGQTQEVPVTLSARASTEGCR